MASAPLIEPVLVGSGGAGEALRQALGMYPADVAAPGRLARGEPLPEPASERSLLVLANPHALHTPRLLEAAERGYRYAICEKPAAVDREQARQLAGLPVRTWVCHGYRLMWGPEELRRAWREGRFGRVMAVEGRYWQAAAVREPAPARRGWKDDPALGGRFDTLLDLATHWADLMVFLSSGLPQAVRVRRWYVNAASAHRDTHVHLTMEHGETTSLGSISKTVHGAGNHLELHVLGEKATASWTFAAPDEIVWGEGRTRRTQVRIERQPPARPAPFHGLGWMEGYVRLVGEVVGAIRHGRASEAPTLEEHLAVLQLLLLAAASDAGGWPEAAVLAPA
jgi:predicted dehydrogenase